MASDPGASALLYLIGANYELIPFSSSGQTGQWLTVTGDETKQFVAPPGVVAFAVQVQSAYEADTDTYVIPSLLAIGENPGTQPEPPMTDPADPADMADLDQQRETFRQSLIGRRGYECQQADFDPYFSARFVQIHIADYWQTNLYFYTSADCSGLPFSDYYPPTVYQYTLGNKVPQASGIEAWEIDREVIVQGLQGTLGPISEPEGTQDFDIIGLVNGDYVLGVGRQLEC